MFSSPVRVMTSKSHLRYSYHIDHINLTWASQPSYRRLWNMISTWFQGVYLRIPSRLPIAALALLLLPRRSGFYVLILGLVWALSQWNNQTQFRILYETARYILVRFYNDYFSSCRPLLEILHFKQLPEVITHSERDQPTSGLRCHPVPN